MKRLKVELYHASKFGNGLKVAEEFQRQMAAKGHQVSVHGIKEVKPKALPQADLYVLVSPARVGKPIRGMRSFAKKMVVPSGSRYAIIATHGAPRPDKKTGKLPSPEEQEKWYTTVRILSELLAPKGLVKVADMKVFVTGLQGPLEEGWQKKVEALVAQVAP